LEGSTQSCTCGRSNQIVEVVSEAAHEEVVKRAEKVVSKAAYEEEFIFVGKQ